uniref:O-methyltransferase domain-containing protein n=3 Tax=Bionectria ochroleuca TaxID=29856 RepID=A0A8H7KA45_BIOOC
MDQLVFVLGAMKERTEADWKSILERAGFQNIQIHSFAMGSEVIIEAELA